MQYWSDKIFEAASLRIHSFHNLIRFSEIENILLLLQAYYLPAWEVVLVHFSSCLQLYYSHKAWSHHEPFARAIPNFYFVIPTTDVWSHWLKSLPEISLLPVPLDSWRILIGGWEYHKRVSFLHTLPLCLGLVAYNGK